MSAVAELLSTATRWTRDGYALDGKGREQSKPTSSKVRRWCLVAAVRACYSDSEVLAVQRKLRLALERRGWDKPIGHWNSEPVRKYGEVLRLVRECGV